MVDNVVLATYVEGAVSGLSLGKHKNIIMTLHRVMTYQLGF